MSSVYVSLTEISTVFNRKVNMTLGAQGQFWDGDIKLKVLQSNKRISLRSKKQKQNKT